ncbi:Translation_elongation factor [Hexamita inflata]|uniref:Translation elongation factor n=1 Tax=Hexamita inflata TaxID=28002 RepID=A0AA86PA79_9EUKA|nr:Translation elongation factor [Hexamita inflata]
MSISLTGSQKPLILYEQTHVVSTLQDPSELVLNYEKTEDAQKHLEQEQNESDLLLHEKTQSQELKEQETKHQELERQPHIKEYKSVKEQYLDEIGQVLRSERQNIILDMYHQQEKIKQLKKQNDSDETKILIELEQQELKIMLDDLIDINILIDKFKKEYDQLIKNSFESYPSDIQYTEDAQRQRIKKQHNKIIQAKKDITKIFKRKHSSKCKTCKAENVLFIRCKICSYLFCIQGKNIQDSDAYKHIRDEKHEIDIEFEVERRFQWEKGPEDSNKEFQKEFDRQSKVCQVETDDKSLQLLKLHQIDELVTQQLQYINKIESKAFNDELQQKAEFYLDPEHIKQKKLQFLMIQFDKSNEQKEQKLIQETQQTAHQVTKRNNFNIFANNQRNIEKELLIKSLQMKIAHDSKNLDAANVLQQKCVQNCQAISNIKETISSINNLVNTLKTQEQKLNYDKNIISEFKDEIYTLLSHLNEVSQSNLFQVLLKLKNNYQSQLLSEMTETYLNEINLVLRIHNQDDEGIQLYQNRNPKYFNHLLPQQQQNDIQFKEQAVTIQIILQTQKNIRNNMKLILENLDKIRKQQIVTISISQEGCELKQEPQNQTDSISTIEEFQPQQITQQQVKYDVQIKMQPKSNLKLTNNKVESLDNIIQEQISQNQIIDALQIKKEDSLTPIENKIKAETISTNIQSQSENKFQINLSQLIDQTDLNIFKDEDTYEEIVQFIKQIKEKIEHLNEYAHIPELIRSTSKQIEISKNELELTKMFNIDSSQKIQAQKDNTEIQKRKDALQAHDITKYLSDRHISVVFCGHVHHGKSTLSQQLLLESIQDPNTRDLERQRLFDLNKTMANGLNSLPEERRTGNTIEYAKRQFDTIGGRHVLLLDAPGHENYILSMIEAATQADIGVLLTSAKQGEYQDGTCGADREAEKRGQTLEHAQILHTCGVSSLIVVINKIDDVSYEQSQKTICEKIVNSLLPQLIKIGFNEKNITFIPVSAKTNINVGRTFKNQQELGENPHTNDLQQKIYDFKQQQFLGEQRFTWFKGFSLMDAIDNICMPFRDIGGFVRIIICSKQKIGQQYLVECKVEKGQFNIKDNDFVLMPINKDIQLESNQCETVFPGDQCVVSVDKITYQQMKTGDIICRKGQECQTQMEFFIALCCVEATLISRGYKAMIHIGGIITEFEVVYVVGVLNDAGVLNSQTKYFGTGERAIIKIRVLGRKNQICVSTFERDEFLGRVLIRHQRTTVGAGVVIEEWNNITLEDNEDNIIETTSEHECSFQNQGSYQNNNINKQQQDQMDPQIKIWQMNNYINDIKAMPAQSYVLTLYIRSSDSPEGVIKMLNAKREKSMNVQNNKDSILCAIDKAKYYISQLQRIPQNGLCIFAGSEMVAFEPAYPVVGSDMDCSHLFNLTQLQDLLYPKEKYIFIVFDGYIACVYSVCGESIKILAEIEADMPKKGAFESLKLDEQNTRQEIRKQYARDIVKMVNQTINDSQVKDVTRIIIAHTSDFKDMVNDLTFKPQLANLVCYPSIEIGYGLQHGVEYAMYKVKQQLKNVYPVREMELSKKFIKIVEKYNSQKYLKNSKKYPKLFCIGLKNVLKCLKMGIIEYVLIQNGSIYDKVIQQFIENNVLWSPSQL